MSAIVAATVIDTLPSCEATDGVALAAANQAQAVDLAEELTRRFDVPFDIVDLADNAVATVFASRELFDSTRFVEPCRRASALLRAEIVADDDVKTLIVPLGPQGVGNWVALADVSSGDEKQMLQLAELFVEKQLAIGRVAELQNEALRLSEHIGATFEEITLIYRLTQNLSIARSPLEIGADALRWLHEVVPAEGLAIYLDLSFDEELFKRDETHVPGFITQGNVPVSVEQFVGMLALVIDRDAIRPSVVNYGIVGDSTGEFASVRQVVLAPLAVGERVFGWLAAFNHNQNREFGSGEANLLASIGTILGIHSGNIDFYKQQADLFAGTVRAMSSAIDAKDPYTRGHSDRVARVSVRLAEELGCDDTTLRTLYLAGLLHDVGKIGIDDGVLRKPGKLTDAEYEHIKTHVEIGYRILRGLKKMGHVLPVVLHHHESWDGKGYPFGLAGANIPFLARIVAVADAYDAMASDRPYRKGMEDEKLDAIFRAGAGRQWDPDVVDAFFRAREDIRQISLRNPDPIDAVSVEWTH